MRASVFFLLFAVLCVSISPIVSAQLGPDDTHIGIPVPKPKQVWLPPLEPEPEPFPPIYYEKKGGSDPLVKDGWWFLERNTKDCLNHNNKFNYDNDGNLENFCYVIIGEIFAVDFNGDGQISHGAEILNFENDPLEPYTPIGFLRTFPDVCVQYDCYWWQDYKMNWKVDEGELEPIEGILHITNYKSYEPDGRKDYQQPNSDVMRFYYGTIEINGEKIYSVKPTYTDPQY